MNISIHAPAKGATIYTIIEYYHLLISIHAPAKGATLVLACSSLSLPYFNPRPREGSDLRARKTLSRNVKFQSTPPRRERHLLIMLCLTLSYFNPRPREGSDVCTVWRCQTQAKFQSTPPRRERHKLAM